MRRMIIPIASYVSVISERATIFFSIRQRASTYTLIRTPAISHSPLDNIFFRNFLYLLCGRRVPIRIRCYAETTFRAWRRITRRPRGISSANNAIFSTSLETYGNSAIVKCSVVTCTSGRVLIDFSRLDRRRGMTLCFAPLLPLT